ncbi:MBOAT family O-acyltransferase [Puia dinghuensis]|uniref:Alginate O-acetyltransferase n=1 Tax=Puia dinghuensis TaxID=1792502 RepID=A0A8J2UEZ7_9BACT|nr:MBOAT family protein [Puia dinghuensis]GGB08561.1 alginate O-acetyltransferase [Puia dinghuensis]
MLFNSFPFLILLLITFGVYYLPRISRYQVGILIISSLVFYAYDSPILVLLLLFSAAINIVTSYYIVSGKTSWKKTTAVIGVALNLLVLCFFKYSPLFAHSFFNSNDPIGHFLVTIPLPIGISFFTFEGISLLVDVFTEKYFDNRKVIDPSFVRHSRNTLFFISFFPHLIAGPILKAHDFLPQIGKKNLRDIDWENSFKHLLVGYFLKMVVADNLKDFTYWIEYPYFQSMSTTTLLALLFGYSCQIFADFAGYSAIAIGLAGLFGYRFQENFNFPYISTSFREFWKRWHISLSSFLMEYLYFPLGGNRKGKIRTYINLMITMILGGLWHGAAISYAVWGGFHGAALATERFISDKVKIKPGRFLLVLKGLMVFCFVTLAWLLFKLPDFSHVLQYLKCIRKNFFILDRYDIIAYILLYSLPVILYHVAYLLRTRSFFLRMAKWEYAIYAVMLFLIVTNSGSTGSFIYFQF